MNIKQKITKLMETHQVMELESYLGVRYQTLYGWMKRNKMPTSEYAGSTHYSAMIEHLTEGDISITDLLDFAPQPQLEHLKQLKRQGYGGIS